MPENKDAEASEAAAAKKSDKSAESGPPTFSKERLIESAASYGSTPVEAAGALAAVDKDRLTVDEARQAVEKNNERVVDQEDTS